MKLSKLLRENNLVDAIMLSFKLDKLRDFFHALNRLVCARANPPRPHIPGMNVPGVAPVPVDKKYDPVEAIIESKASFE